MRRVAMVGMSVVGLMVMRCAAVIAFCMPASGMVVPAIMGGGVDGGRHGTDVIAFDI